MSAVLPAEMWFGTIDGQWPIYCWKSKTHAMAWLSQGGPEERRRLWKAPVGDAVEFECVVPDPFLQQVSP